MPPKGFVFLSHSAFSKVGLKIILVSLFPLPEQNIHLQGAVMVVRFQLEVIDLAFLLGSVQHLIQIGADFLFDQCVF